MLISREERKRKQRQRARKSRSQLLGPVAQGGQGRAPMRQGYTTTTVKPPEFQKPYDAGAGITQAGLAFKGGRGVNEFVRGKEAYIDEAGKFHKAREPWSLGDKSISDRLSQYGTDVSDRFTSTPRDFKSLFDTQPSPSELAQLERANIGFGGNQGLLGPKPPPQLGAGAGEGMTFLQGPRISGMPTGAATGMSSLNAPMNAAASFGQGLGGEAALSNLFSGAGAGAGGMQGLGHLGSFSGGTEGIQGLGHLSGTGGGGTGLSFGGGSTPFGTLNQGGTGIQAGTSTATPGLQSGGGQPWLAYANIGKDLIMGGPGSEKITGNTYGDAAIRAAAAYFTFGLSEIPYALF